MGLSWGDLNPISWPGQVKRRLQKDFGFLGEESESAIAQRQNLEQQGKFGSVFADEGQHNYARGTADLADAADAMRRRASGQDSLSAEQLRQGLQQNLAAQRSMAASASPQNAVMASRNAMNNANRAGIGMSGQAATAGIQERAAAEQALAKILLEKRQQDAQVALGSRQNAISGYGGAKPEGSWMDKYGAATAQGLGWAASDRRLKTDIEKSPDAKWIDAFSKIPAYTFRYKDEKHGKGEQYGIMAQDLEKAGLGHVVRDEPDGKMIDGAKLAAANTAFLGALAREARKGKR